MSYTVSITPRNEREVTIKKSYDSSEEKGEPIYDFRGEKFIPKVISLPISLPIYRMGNSRTFSAQQTEIARKGWEKDYFIRGQELISCQQFQHEILYKLAIPDTVTSITEALRLEGQRETILITRTGVVVDGNRRLSAIRELSQNKDGTENRQFSYVKCSVLPADISPDEIQDIEANLQARPQTKLDYDWVGDANLIRRLVDNGKTVIAVADKLRRKKTEVENVLQALEEADLYLSEWLDKPGEYELVLDGQQIFGDIPKQIAKQDSNLKEFSRAVAWSLYKNRDKVSGRLYQYNASFGKLSTKVFDSLKESLKPVLEIDQETEEDEDEFSFELDEHENSIDYTSVINILRDKSKANENTEILIDVCESAIENEKEQNRELLPLKLLVQINSKLSSVDLNQAKKDTLPGINEQLKTIHESLKRIEREVIKISGGEIGGFDKEDTL